jgi:hypothetical protein
MFEVTDSRSRGFQRFFRLLLWAILPLWFGSALASGYRAIKAPELRVHIGAAVGQEPIPVQVDVWTSGRGVTEVVVEVIHGTTSTEVARRRVGPTPPDSSWNFIPSIGVINLELPARPGEPQTLRVTAIRPYMFTWRGASVMVERPLPEPHFPAGTAR